MPAVARDDEAAAKRRRIAEALAPNEANGIGVPIFRGDHFVSFITATRWWIKPGEETLGPAPGAERRVEGVNGATPAPDVRRDSRDPAGDATGGLPASPEDPHRDLRPRACRGPESSTEHVGPGPGDATPEAGRGVGVGSIPLVEAVNGGPPDPVPRM